MSVVCRLEPLNVDLIKHLQRITCTKLTLLYLLHVIISGAVCCSA